MTIEQYDSLINELNFNDTTVGLNPINIKDNELMNDIIKELGYTPIGYYETNNSKGYKFKDDHETYSIKEVNGQLKVNSLIQL